MLYCERWIIFFLVSVLVLSIVALVLNFLHKRELIRLSKFQTYVSMGVINSSIPDLLTDVINDSFNDYKLEVLIPLNEGYINENREHEIRKDLVDKVTSRIAVPTLEKLSLFYNINNIGEIIGDKVYIAVVDYVVDHNRKIEESKPNTLGKK